MAFVEVELSKIKAREDGQVAIKIGTLGEGGVESDDFLGEDKWINLSLNKEAQGFMNIPEIVELKGNSKVSIDLEKGEGKHDLVVYFPKNRSNRIGSNLLDAQEALLRGILSL